MIAGCALATSCYMVWFKKLIARYDVVTMLRWVYCLAALMVLPFGLKSRECYQLIKARKHKVGEPFSLSCKGCDKVFESKHSNALLRLCRLSQQINPK